MGFKQLFVVSFFKFQCQNSRPSLRFSDSSKTYFIHNPWVTGRSSPPKIMKGQIFDEINAFPPHNLIKQKIKASPLLTFNSNAYLA